MRIDLRITAQNGQETIKSLEEITSDAEAAKKQFLFEVYDQTLAICIKKAIFYFKNPTDFANEVNNYRQFALKTKYGKRHPLKIRFYK